ncbi:transglutaminase [Stappia sp. GBMRC 2046]|uniref:Transglutaminase n=1 Tax=Stappia sediminis TaxID=2692190 RepID=A0A7X3S6B9_9HYPH|nr:transglutaminase-like cysteine peptidase [Stappia sediminis]MXN63826.1 transglutaminase [Stappia sediminis]
MINTSNRLVTGAATIFFVIAGTFTAEAETGRFMNVHGAASTPVGHQGFCREYPDECRANRGSPVVVRLTEGLWNELLAINSSVNRRIRPVTDAELYGVEEYWTYPRNGTGDCEEYVLEKQRELVSRGWPRSALLITVVKDRNNAGHAVLTVRTDKGDIILDNQLEVVLPWYSTPYRYVKRQSAKNPARWARISDTRVSTVASIGN